MNRIYTKAVVCALTSLLLMGASQASAYSKYHQGYIEKISDGDTVWFQPGSRRLAEVGESLFNSDLGWGGASTRLKIRMMGMDSPESQLPTKKYGVVGQGNWGKRATQYLNRLVHVNERVVLQDLGNDKYRRTLGYLFNKDKADINLAMVLGGYAIPYIICSGRSCNPSFFKEQRVREYFMTCDEARRARRGIFNPSNPLREMPFEFRLRMMERTPEKFVVDYDSHELYMPEDYKEVDVCRRIFFMRSEDALKMGFKWSDIYE